LRELTSPELEAPSDDASDAPKETREVEAFSEDDPDEDETTACFFGVLLWLLRGSWATARATEVLPGLRGSLPPRDPSDSVFSRGVADDVILEAASNLFGSRLWLRLRCPKEVSTSFLLALLRVGAEREAFTGALLTGTASLTVQGKKAVGEFYKKIPEWRLRIRGPFLRL